MDDRTSVRGIFWGDVTQVLQHECDKEQDSRLTKNKIHKNEAQDDEGRSNRFHQHHHISGVVVVGMHISPVLDYIVTWSRNPCFDVNRTVDASGLLPLHYRDTVGR